MRKHLYITLLIILSGVTACSFVIINDSPVIYKSMEEAMKTPDEVTHLKLIRKKFKVFPKEILNFKNLEYLDLSKNKIDSLPNEFYSLVNLNTLVIKSNRFKEFPEAICSMKRLKKISFADNEITSIPSYIAGLDSLEELDLFRNSVEDVSIKISKLLNLKKLDLRMIEISKDEQNRIEMLVPNCKVLMTEPCNCSTKY
ncbi:MAG: leucine-rich repeat domain-containing protein [Flavobacteriales bacterium]|jgi:Leucine-rich repeat (LRR) protein|nr:leucine-rich repeat domain-containing protein [bacterium]MDB9932720.1 leucine-rich repeat domain-containing protein [Flavobacteriales bacterium]MDG1175629.1 leucine-rich repeat domain-containing protein [Flavobacteriales bacterium]